LENPLVIANEYVNESISNRFLGSTFLQWEILEGLSFKTSINLDYNYFVDEGFVPKGYNQTDEGLGDFASWEESNVINENTLSYSKIFDKHNLNVLVGYTWQVQDIDQAVIFGQSYPSNRKYKLINATTITSALTDAESYGLVSYLGRISYGYDDRYLLQLTVRRDGSSRFGPDSRFGNFPSASFAWRLSNEDFMEGTSNWLSELKPRISYGVIGNQEIGNNVWQARWNLSSPYNEQGGSQPSNLENANLGWESTSQLNVGIDIGLFNNRFSIVADYFNKQTEDLLLATNVPGNTGFKTVFANAGTIENRGFEFALTSTNIEAGDFTWKSTFNFTSIENEVVDVVNDGQLLSRNFILKEGESLSSLYLVRFLGVDPTTGDAMFEDINSDGEINQDDRQIVGQGIPTYFGGFDNNFTYKGFSLRVFFQFSGGNDIFNQSRFAYENYGAFPGSASIPYGNYNKRSLDYWREPGDVTSIPRPSHAREGSADAQFYRFSTQYLEDGSFVRLRNVRLAYTFPNEWISAAGLNSLTLYFSGQNLYTWTKYLGFDPEINTNTASAESLNTLQGEDFGTLGQARTFMFGINIGL
jgi:TonB-linked SusC/RagA family outer membrane protein